MFSAQTLQSSAQPQPYHHHSCTCDTHYPVSWHAQPVVFLPKTTAHCPPNLDYRRLWASEPEEVAAYERAPPQDSGYFATTAAAPPQAFAQGNWPAPHAHPTTFHNPYYPPQGFVEPQGPHALRPVPSGSAVPYIASGHGPGMSIHLAGPGPPRQAPLYSAALTQSPSALAVPDSQPGPVSHPSTASSLNSLSLTSSSGSPGVHSSSSGEVTTRRSAGSSSASRIRRYACDICSKRFSRPSSLRTHLNSHTGARPYVCVCTRRFSVLSNMRRHQRGGKCPKPAGETGSQKGGQEAQVQVIRGPDQQPELEEGEEDFEEDEVMGIEQGESVF